jgi:hypothetical protein
VFRSAAQLLESLALLRGENLQQVRPGPAGDRVEPGPHLVTESSHIGFPPGQHAVHSDTLCLGQVEAGVEPIE